MPYLPYAFFILAVAAAVGFFLLNRVVFAHTRVLKRLMGGDGETTDVQAEMLRRIMRLETAIEVMEPRVQMLEAIGKMSVQRVGFLRFNPFSDTGGDNSFVVVLLDAERDGVMISSLYTREGVRIYGKQIEKGSSRHPLSEEEHKTLQSALQ